MSPRRSGAQSPSNSRLNGAVLVLGAPHSGLAVAGSVLGFLAGSGESRKPSASEMREPGNSEAPAILARLNQELIDSVGKPAIQTSGSDWAAPKFDAIRARAAETITSGIAKPEFWGWADWRNSITLPFWQQVVPNLKCVVCVRSPKVIADLLAGANAEQAIWKRHVDDWIRYTALALEHTSSLPRFVLHYERLQADPSAEARALAKFIEREARLDDSTFKARMRELVDPSISKTPASTVAAEPRIGEEVAGFYLSLWFMSARSRRESSARKIDNDWKMLDRFAGRLRTQVDDRAQNRLNARVTAGDDASLRARVTEHEATIAALQAALAERDTRLFSQRVFIREQSRGLRFRDNVLERQRQELAEIIGSPSWRVTGPLRRMRKIVGGRGSDRSQESTDKENRKT